MTTTNCKKCGKVIIFAKTTTGRQMPLDAEPDDDGRLVLANGLVRNVLPSEEDSDIPRYTCHFTTCPSAAEFRKRR